MTKGTHRALRAYIRKTARLVLILNRLIRNDVIKHSSSSTGNLCDVLLRAVIASLDALKLVDTIDSSSTPHTALIVKSVLCLALSVRNPSPSASEVEGNVASTLVDGLLQGSMPDFEDETGRDILAWLLQGE